ncbi:hypothetical protein AwPolaro_04970 [Polaromonas sp.]|nr:hypothetical protein AwPolaro_04970 [Polaromonas sp.]
MPKKNRPLHRQRGISLLESLVAIIVMALGILGVLGLQLRTLADTQNSVNRAQAIRFIEDLSERMKINPNALGNLGSYVSGWQSVAPTTPPKNCAAASDQAIEQPPLQAQMAVKTYFAVCLKNPCALAGASCSN